MNYLFIDLETTGLSVAQDKIIEVGMVVTNHLFVPVDTFNVVVRTKEDDWALVHDTVNQMHIANGLREESFNSGLENDDAEFLCMQFVNSCRWLGPQPYMCGNGVHFDRKFLDKYMPNLHDLFHYRNFDVSTLKQMVMAVLPGYEFLPSNGTHRAIPDCLEAAAIAGDILEYFADCLRLEDAKRSLINRLVRPDSA